MKQTSALPLVWLLWLLTATLPACTLSPAAEPPAPAAAEQQTGISGRVLDADDRPATGAYVYAYRSLSRNLRGPADFEAAVGGDGSYFLDLSAGEYYLVARMRQGGGDAGPPRPGDSWSLPPANPVRVEAGRIGRVDFRLQSLVKSMAMREMPLTSGTTGFAGRLVDGAGHPVGGAFVLAYRTGDFHRMPDFTSSPIAADGRFILYLPEAGAYCLVARTRTRGQPTSNELYGVWTSADGACPRVEQGQILELGPIVLKPYRR